MFKPQLIAFDADDTLWHTEKIYREIQQKFNKLLAPSYEVAHIEGVVEEIEIPNLSYYGYGINGFILSLVEAAVQLSGEQIDSYIIQELISMGKNAHTAEIQLFENVEETLQALSHLPIALITKGDLLHQENKINRSGLKKYFEFIEIVSEKTPDAYRSILEKHHIEPDRFLMIGDSLRSDILPVIECGGQAVHIPSSFVWQHENSISLEELNGRYYQIEHIGLLPALVEQIANSA